MKRSIGKPLCKYAIAVLACGALSWIYLSSRDFALAERLDQYRMLSDAFLIPGMTALMVGFLILISNLGGLNGISYALGRAARMLLPGGSKKDEKFLDYVTHKRENPIRGYGFLFVVGGVFFAVSIVFMILFYGSRG